MSSSCGPSRAEIGAARSAIYRRMFGELAEVSKDPIQGPDPIDVEIYRPGHAGREFYTLITSGMSDRAMNVPDDVGRDGRRAEIALYVDMPGPSFIEMVRTVAKLPFTHSSWVGHGHSIPNGMPPSPLFPGSQLCALLILMSNVAPERDAYHVVEIAGDPLHILWPVPITESELALKLERGTEALLEVFNEKQLSFVLDIGRTSLV